jgi:hypothetical protein
MHVVFLQLTQTTRPEAFRSGSFFLLLLVVMGRSMEKKFHASSPEIRKSVGSEIMVNDTRYMFVAVRFI